LPPAKQPPRWPRLCEDAEADPRFSSIDVSPAWFAILLRKATRRTQDPATDSTSGHVPLNGINRVYGDQLHVPHHAC
jgi:hypothetical protein